jgi:hypothetical protein
VNANLNLDLTVPTFDDCNSLPQIEAFMLECLRWRPVTTLGFAHRALTDIVYVRLHCVLAWFPDSDRVLSRMVTVF